MSSSEGRTRREILADAAKAAAAASVAGLAGCFPSVGGRWPSACKSSDAGTTTTAGDSRAITPAVVEVHRDESVVTGATAVIQPDVVATMLDTGLTALASQVKTFNAGASAQTGGSAAADTLQTSQDGGTDNPWTVLLPNYKPGQRIGLKVNCLGNTPTSPAVVRAIIASLRDKLGVDPTTIVVWDRTYKELAGAGKYTADDLAGAQLAGTLVRAPGDGETLDDAALTAGNGYGDPVCVAPIGVPPTGVTATFPRLSRILTDKTDLTINCPVFKVHNITGITGCMKNIYGMIDNPAQYHTPNFKTDLPKLYALGAIRNSISLLICDALLGVVTGNEPAAIHDSAPGRILLAQDPVALDSYILALISQLRASAGKSAVDSDDPTKTVWLDNAAELKLGTRSYSLVQV
jgi:hypothetical protein